MVGITGYAYSDTTYFEDDFEDGSFNVSSGNPQPTWYWPDNDATNGANAWWKITDADAHSGTYSIRLDYLARNRFASHCGVKTCNQKAGKSGTYLVEPNGLDFTNPENGYIGSGSIIGRYVWDKTKNFTKWQITGVVSGGCHQ